MKNDCRHRYKTQILFNIQNGKLGAYIGLEKSLKWETTVV